MLGQGRLEAQRDLRLPRRRRAASAGASLRQLPPEGVRASRVPVSRGGAHEGLRVPHERGGVLRLHRVLHPHGPHLPLPPERVVAAARGEHHRPAVGNVERRRREAGGGPRISPGARGEAGLDPPHAGRDTGAGPSDSPLPQGDRGEPHRHHRGRGGEGREAEGPPGRHAEDRAGLRGRRPVRDVADAGRGGGGGVSRPPRAGPRGGHAAAAVRTQPRQALHRPIWGGVFGGGDGEGGVDGGHFLTGNGKGVRCDCFSFQLCLLGEREEGEGEGI